LTVSTRTFAPFVQLRSLNRDARLFLLAVLINGVVISAWQLFFNFLILARGFDKDFLGLVNAMPSAAALLFGIPLGLLSDRIGRRWAMAGGLAGWSLAMVFQVCVPHGWAILLAAFLGGLGSMLFAVSQFPYMMSVSDDRNRAMLFSLNFGVVSFAGIVGNLFAGQLPALYNQVFHTAPKSAPAYQAVLLGSVLIGVLALVPIFLLREKRPSPASAGRKTSQPLARVLLHPIVLKLAIPNLVIGLGASLIIPYWNVFFAERFKMPDQTLGILFSLGSGVIVIGTLVGPLLIDALGSKIRAVVFTTTVSLGFLLLVGFSKLGWLAALGFLGRGVFISIGMSLYAAYSMEQIAPAEQGAVNSLLNICWQVGWVVGPYVSGVVQTNYGFTPLFVAAGILYGLAVILVWGFFGKGSPLPKAEPRLVEQEGVG
jgi:MFS family permease